MSEHLARELGEIKGLLQGIDKKIDSVDDRLDKHDTRLRAVETKSVVNSVIAASVVSIGIAFIKDKIGA
ncbi:hypothetical protein [Pseudovibrio sp. Tun.PSC04-5.I4]|uniref:hypothetical protein n=1 Tax=Pseudovibrio sp. Tun.PSC04-5.I4 TaxID=1798213 RepID=UPI000886A3AA|nr:hypothetical protein [Pseudovibrio sp. Tun.PSC04-5.I4]SDQ17763.1 hypothetical protein SAMN04515695_0338 [Pseudovibrio sp. Tun.PSC04-5.I4]SDR40447.1 hypothetical protein SAMN04515695_5431 [Pseudovibrio sp. Tun.PSC04-5.I4]